MQLNGGRSTAWTFAHFLIAQCGLVWPTSLTSAVGGQRCRTHDDCDSTLGQKCYRLYDECQIGQCMCNPKRHRQEASGHCRPVKYGNERCSDAMDDCLEGMSCTNGYCQCKVGTMTPDGHYCLLPGQRLLGQKCRPASGPNNSCLRKSSTGYTKYDVRCSSKGECECEHGYKAEGITCRRWNIYEYGCTSTVHCQGGAICVDGQCVCPSEYIAVAGNSKCAKRGALIDLPSGDTCDEINELRYCARTLICHRCQIEDVFRCVSFLMVSDYSYLSSVASVSARRLKITHTLLIPSSVLCLLLTIAPFHSPR